MTMCPKPTSAGGEEVDRRDPKPLGRVEREAHVAVGDDARDPRAAAGAVVESLDEVREGRQAVRQEGFAELGDILGRVLVRGREAVRDGREAEVREAGHGGGPPGAEEAVVVELGVDEGDEEAAGVEELGELEEGVEVALRRVWDHDGVRALHFARWLPPPPCNVFDIYTILV